MRQTARALNRGWLAVLGLVLFLAGVAGVLFGTGLWVSLAAATGLGLTRPGADNRVLGSGAAGFFASTTVVVGVALLGVLLGLLGLSWLIAQVPRVNSARELRLHDDAARGLTIVQPGALTDAVEREAVELAGVSAASAVLRGTAAAPELTVKVTADERSDLQQVLLSVRDEVAAHLSTALDAPLRRLAVQVEISRTRRRSTSVTL